MLKKDVIRPENVTNMGYGRFKMILDSNGKPLDAEILEVSPSFEIQFDRPSSELIGQSKFEFFNDFYKGQEQQWLQKYYNTAFHQKSFSEVVFFKPLDIYFEITVSSPKEGEFITLFQDVTDRLNQDTKYYDILLHMSDVVFITDEKGSFTFVGPSVAKQFGHSVEEVFELNYIENIIGQSYKTELNKLKSEGDKVVDLECSFVNKEGKLYQLMVDISRVNIGNGCFLFMLQDVTDKNQALKLAREQKEQLNAIINTIPDLIWMKDIEGKYLACNREFEIFYGASETNILGKTDEAFVSKKLASFFRKNDLKAMNLKMPSKNEETLVYKNCGKTIDVETTKTPFYDANGEMIGVLGIARDITARNITKNQ